MNKPSYASPVTVNVSEGIDIIAVAWDEHAWLDLGRRLRKYDPEAAERVLEMMRAMVAE